jgi:hypothetical protein
MVTERPAQIFSDGAAIRRECKEVIIIGSNKQVIEIERKSFKVLLS